MLKYVFLMIAGVSLFSCSVVNNKNKHDSQHRSASNAEVIKSISDTRLYRAVTLVNGLKVILISDVQADTAAASLDVFVGSAQNPAKREGLAHFLEHMLFLGTEKYPQASEYQQFIKENGGANNAYTSFEHTNYFFDIKPSALEQGLDRFAQFFIAPLLNDQYVEREKNAVNAEYQAGLKNEFRRSLAVLREVINPQHPFSRFSVGNLATLNSHNAAVRNDLLMFYRKHYFAENMALSVLGRQTLDELEMMVRAKFDEVPMFSVFNGDAEIPSYQINSPFLNDAKLPLWVSIKPEKNKRSLRLVFALPSQQPRYPDRSLEVIGHVLGHEGKGSLLSYLKTQNLAEDLSAGQFIDYRGGTSFSVFVNLTEQGVNEQELVLQAIFSALKVLSQQGIPRWIFDELAMISRLSFDYQDQLQAGQAVVHLSSHLHRYPARDALRANYVFDDYDEAQVVKLLRQMTVERVLILTVAASVSTDKVTKYYQVPYAVKPLTEVLLQALKNPQINSVISLPERNVFLPKKLKLAKKTKKSVPVNIVNEAGFSVWYKGRDQFTTPKSVMYFSFQHNNITRQLSDAVQLQLYVDLLNDSLNEMAYPANFAGMGFDLYPHSRGITLKVSGFSERQSDLLLALLNKIQVNRFTLKQYARIQSSLRKHWQNAEKRAPYKKLLARLRKQMHVGSWSNADKLAQLDQLSLTDINAFGKSFWRAVNVQALFNGNVTKKQALTVAAKVKAQMPSLIDVRSVLELVRLDQSMHHQVQSDHSDKAYVLYLQGENNGLEQQVMWMLLSKVLESGFFNQLRTEQQLGYIVFAAYYKMLDVPGMIFTIQSPSADVDRLHQSVTGFLMQQWPRLGLLGLSQFDTYKEAVLKELLERDNNLGKESDRYWHWMAMDAQVRAGRFHRREQLVNTLRQLSLGAWHAFAKQLSEQGMPMKRSYVLTTPSRQTFSGFTTKMNSVQTRPYRYP